MAGAPQIDPPTPAVTGPFHPDSLLLLHKALEFWRSRGLCYVDLPWMVPQAYSDATRPTFCRDIPTLYGSFVASGEQSFLQLWDENRLPASDSGYVGWTPCLRDEPALDDTHQHGFMKVELFLPLKELWPAYGLLYKLLFHQRLLFKELARAAGIANSPEASIEAIAADQLDLVIGGLEVGSYGVREFNGRHYLYGTALALPRFTRALERREALSARLAAGRTLVLPRLLQ